MEKSIKRITYGLISGVLIMQVPAYAKAAGTDYTNQTNESTDTGMNAADIDWDNLTQEDLDYLGLGSNTNVSASDIFTENPAGLGYSVDTEALNEALSNSQYTASDDLATDYVIATDSEATESEATPSGPSLLERMGENMVVKAVSFILLVALIIVCCAIA